jgi:LPS O-antigen subunit length determinant protein (WzzB/FepE family)
LIQERNKILNITNEKDILSTFLYRNTIQKNTALKNSYKNQIHYYTSQIGEKKFELKEWQREVEIQAQELEELEKENENIQNLQVVQSPTGRPQQIRPNTKFNIVFAAAAGFLFSMFLAFFLEYFSKHRRNLD